MKERRRCPRYKAWIACSVSLLGDNDAQERPSKILGHTLDLSTEAVTIVLPANQTYGIDPQTLGSTVEVTLALPSGYVSLSCSLVRHSPLPSQENLVVFAIDDENATYRDHLKTLRN